MKERSASPTQTPGPVVAYFLATRGAWYSFLFALPILLGYELLLFVFRPRWVNGADAFLDRLLAPLGLQHSLWGWPLLIVICGLCCWYFDGARKRLAGQQLQGRFFLGMFTESFVYALFLGGVVTRLMRLMAGDWQLQIGGSGGVLNSVIQSLGAGLYEELVFRVLLMGLLLLILMKGCKADQVISWVVAVVISSLVFSAVHYVGLGSDAFSLESFIFRFLAGAVLASLYAARGFGIAVWTHALYDLMVMLR
ncbi:MAG: CPBP family intramembrane metalloprotease [Fimbriimonadaceae bacterium]|nr:CPBP family intramembrane metalloprotease [Fimbriimonadaceae bacterium]